MCKLTIFILLVFPFFNVYAQPVVTFIAAQELKIRIHYDPNRDTVSDIFSQEMYTASFDVPKDDSITVRPQDLNLQIKTGNTEWLYVEKAYSQCDLYYILRGNEKFKFNLNLLHFFLSNPIPISTNQGYISCQVRIESRIDSKKNGFKIYYSNIDTLVIPPPNTDDVDALNYLKNSDMSLNSFARRFLFNPAYDTEYYTARDSFKSSLISEIAEMTIFRSQYSQTINPNITIDQSERNYVKSVYDRLIHSKSVSIRNTMSDYSEKYIK